MTAWAEMADRHMNGDEIKDEYGDQGRRDVAVDVMTIVGSVLWGGPTFFSLKSRFRERRYGDNLIWS